MRVEEGYSSFPLSPSPDTMFSLPQQANQFLLNSGGGVSTAPSTGIPSWLFGLGLNLHPQQQQPPAPTSAPGPTPGLDGQFDQAEAFPGLAQLSAMLPWLLPSTARTPAPPMA